MVYGELGVIPPNILANISNIIFHIRLKSLPKDDIVCQLYNDLLMLDDNGFDILKTSGCYNIDVSSCLFNARCVRCGEMAPQFFKYNLWGDGTSIFQVQSLGRWYPSFSSTISGGDGTSIFQVQSLGRWYLNFSSTISGEMVPQFCKYNLCGHIMGDGTSNFQVQSLGEMVPQFFKYNLYSLGRWYLNFSSTISGEMVPEFFKYNLCGHIMGDGTSIFQVQSLGSRRAVDVIGYIRPQRLYLKN